MKIISILIIAAIILISIIVIYLFMIAPRIFNRPDYSTLFKPTNNNSSQIFFAHRGLFDNETEFPENSLPAFERAIQYGYGIELDIQLSKDNIPVVFHDATLERMCKVKGNVRDYTLKELNKFTLANSHQTIPSFEEVLSKVAGKVPLIIEYKLDTPKTHVCELTNTLLKDYKGTYCIESFHPFALLWYKKNRPDIIRGQLSMNFLKEPKYKRNPLYLVLSNLLFNFLTRPDFIAYKHSDASNLSRRICTKLSAIPVAWTIQSPEQYQKAKDNFDLFIFDSFIPNRTSAS